MMAHFNQDGPGRENAGSVGGVGTSGHVARYGVLKDGAAGLYMKDRAVVIERIQRLTDELFAIEQELNLTVGAARACVNGLSWEEVGQAFGGVTRQGAQQRFRDASARLAAAQRDDEEAAAHGEPGTVIKNLRRRLGIVMRGKAVN